MNDKYLREHTPTLDDIIFTRRDFLVRTGLGMGALSLASLFGLNPFDAQAAPTAPGKTAARRWRRRSRTSPCKAKHDHPHFRRRRAVARRHLGSQARSSAKYADKTIPGHDGLAFPSPFKFNEDGQVGHRSQRGLPQARRVRRRHGVIRSMWTDIPAHELASALHAHRLAAAPQAVAGLVGGLRPGHREPEHARLHLAGRQAGVAPGVVPAGPVPGRERQLLARTCRSTRCC